MRVHFRPLLWDAEEISLQLVWEIFEKVIPKTSEEVIGSHKQIKTSWTSNKIECYKKNINRPHLLAKQEHDQSSEEITKTAQANTWKKEAQQLENTIDQLEKQFTWWLNSTGKETELIFLVLGQLTVS